MTSNLHSKVTVLFKGEYLTNSAYYRKLLQNANRKM